MSKRDRYDGPGGKIHEVCGALHMHTLYSDGTGTVEEIARYADQRGLKFVIITDHCHLRAKENGEEGRYGGVWALVGTELGDEDLPNHYLTYGIDKVPPQDNPAEMVRLVKEMGGFGAIAHPHEKRTAFKDMPPYPWTAWDAHIDGIEIWNQLSQWVEGLTPLNRVYRFLHPLKSLTKPQPETLAIWDILNQQRPVVGYVGVDAHALKYPLLFGLLHVKVFHYKVQFRSLLTHLLLNEPLETEDFKRAESQILTALSSGSHFGANHRVGNPRGFRFHAICEGQRFLPISTLNAGKRVEFHAHSPLEAELVLVRDGQRVIDVQGRDLRYVTDEPGVYRIESYRKKKGWVFTNPIRLIQE